MPSSGEQAPTVRIGRQSFRTRMLLAAGGSGTSAGVAAAGAVPGLIRTVFPAAAVGAVVALAIVFVVVISVVGLAVAALLVPGLHASRDGLQVRVGRQVFRAEEISSATLRPSRYSQVLTTSANAAGICMAEVPVSFLKTWKTL